METPFEFKLDQDGIATLVFNSPHEKNNVFSDTNLDYLEQTVDSFNVRNDIKALIIESGKEDTFIVGADLKEIQKALAGSEMADKFIRKGHRVFRKISALPFPTIASINGLCVGGGTELVISCTYRVVTDNPKTQLGLPEVTLGIFPGWGGTQRLPRLIGLAPALEMILSGKPVTGLKAYKLHLADAIVATEFRKERTREFVRQILTPAGKEKVLARRKRSGFTNFLLEGNPIGRAFLFSKVEKDVKAKTKGFYPAPLIALNLIKNTYTLPLNDGLEKEIDTINKSFKGGLANARNLLQIFFNNEALKKNPGVPDASLKGKPVENTAVIGAGVMGAGIAWLFSNYGHKVLLKDINWDVIGKGYGTAYSIYQHLVKTKRIKAQEANIRFLRINGIVDYSGFKSVDLVLEAAVENIDLKRQIYAELEKVMRPDALIASNTSSLPIKDLSANLKNPERFIGIHFFNPPNKMPLVEIIPGPKTSPQTIATAINFIKSLGKSPVVVADVAGFLVNRLLTPGANEANWLVSEGVPVERLEKLALGFGMPMGPATLSDEVGYDTFFKVVKILENAYGDRFTPPKFSQDMYDKKLFGKKVGRGFFLYEGKDKKLNPDIQQLVGNKSAPNISDDEITDRIQLAMVNEAARCLDEKVVSSAGNLDMAVIMGIGYPPFRGGILRYADDYGIDRVVARLQEFEKKYGSRFAPAPLLLKMKQDVTSFYSPQPHSNLPAKAQFRSLTTLASK